MSTLFFQEASDRVLADRVPSLPEFSRQLAKALPSPLSIGHRVASRIGLDEGPEVLLQGGVLLLGGLAPSPRSPDPSQLV